MNNPQIPLADIQSNLEWLSLNEALERKQQEVLAIEHIFSSAKILEQFIYKFQYANELEKKAILETLWIEWYQILEFLAWEKLLDLNAEIESINSKGFKTYLAEKQSVKSIMEAITQKDAIENNQANSATKKPILSTESRKKILKNAVSLFDEITDSNIPETSDILKEVYWESITTEVIYSFTLQYLKERILDFHRKNWEKKTGKLLDNLEQKINPNWMNIIYEELEKLWTEKNEAPQYTWSNTDTQETSSESPDDSVVLPFPQIVEETSEDQSRSTDDTQSADETEKNKGELQTLTKVVEKGNVKQVDIWWDDETTEKYHEGNNSEENELTQIPHTKVSSVGSNSTTSELKNPELEVKRKKIMQGIEKEWINTFFEQMLKKHWEEAISKGLASKQKKDELLYVTWHELKEGEFMHAYFEALHNYLIKQEQEKNATEAPFDIAASNGTKKQLSHVDTYWNDIILRKDHQIWTIRRGKKEYVSFSHISDSHIHFALQAKDFPFTVSEVYSFKTKRWLLRRENDIAKSLKTAIDNALADIEYKIISGAYIDTNETMNSFIESDDNETNTTPGDLSKDNESERAQESLTNNNDDELEDVETSRFSLSFPGSRVEIWDYVVRRDFKPSKDIGNGIYTLTKAARAFRTVIHLPSYNNARIYNQSRNPLVHVVEWGLHTIFWIAEITWWSFATVVTPRIQKYSIYDKQNNHLWSYKSKMPIKTKRSLKKIVKKYDDEWKVKTPKWSFGERPMGMMRKLGRKMFNWSNQHAVKNPDAPFMN